MKVYNSRLSFSDKGLTYINSPSLFQSTYQIIRNSKRVMDLDREATVWVFKEPIYLPNGYTSIDSESFDPDTMEVVKNKITCVRHSESFNLILI